MNKLIIEAEYTIALKDKTVFISYIIDGESAMCREYIKNDNDYFVNEQPTPILIRRVDVAAMLGVPVETIEFKQPKLLKIPQNCTLNEKFSQNKAFLREK